MLPKIVTNIPILRIIL